MHAEAEARESPRCDGQKYLRRTPLYAGTHVSSVGRSSSITMDSNMSAKLFSKIVKASKGQRDAMYFAARRMNMINDLLVIPTVITSAILGSTLIGSNIASNSWAKYFCASIAFLNVMLVTIQRVSRPGEYGEMYQSYGRKWELFALNLLSVRKWKTGEADSEKTPVQQSSSLVEKYNNMIEQSPLLPRWALSKFKECNEGLSSDDEDGDMLKVSIPHTSITLQEAEPERTLEAPTRHHYYRRRSMVTLSERTLSEIPVWPRRSLEMSFSVPPRIEVSAARERSTTGTLHHLSPLSEGPYKE